MAIFSFGVLCLMFAFIDSLVGTYVWYHSTCIFIRQTWPKYGRFLVVIQGGCNVYTLRLQSFVFIFR